MLLTPPNNGIERRNISTRGARNGKKRTLDSFMRILIRSMLIRVYHYSKVMRLRRKRYGESYNCQAFRIEQWLVTNLE